MRQSNIHAGITVFFSYAQVDQGLREQLATHLSLLKRNGLIEAWSDQQVLAGSDRAQEIDQAIRRSRIILLLISADFLTSDVCYQIEMQHALERHRRGEARVIPIIVRPCEWQYSPFAHLQCLPRNAKPITTWSNQDEAFVAIVQELRKVITQQQFPAPSLSSSQRQNRARLLKQVRAIWIKGLLEDSLHQAIWIDLHLQEQPKALENTSHFQAQECDQTPHALPVGKSIVEVYDEADGDLLILGEPGSGKTTLLLQLARTLLDRAEVDERLPMPVVFNLSSWAQKQEPLAPWLVEELETRYQISRQIGGHWIEGKQILPLLDGLDEVADSARVACVQAITAYYHQNPSQAGISRVLCCRSEESRALALYSPQQCAVSILPLAGEQINGYIARAQGQLEGLQQALRDNADLYKLARQPLMLSIFTLAYKGVSAEELPTGLTQEQTLLHAVFSTYVKRMLFRREKLRQWKQEQSLRWLICIAKQLHRQRQTVFSVYDIRPDWLQDLQPRLYRRNFILVFGLITGLIAGLIFGVGCGLIAELNIWLRVGQTDSLTDSLSIVLGCGLIFGVGCGLVACLSTWRAFRRNHNRMRQAEVISWSWKDVHKSLTDELTVGLIVGLVSVLIIGLSGGLGLGLAAGLGFKLTDGLTNGLTAGVIVWLIVGLVFGVIAFDQHFILRFWLWHTNCLPWNLARFLDEAAERLILRKVGRSYIFVHRLLLDYFATLDDLASLESIFSQDRTEKE